MVEGSKQVRVDNWGVFFLQRLQMFFSKTDYCDLTLQFEGNVQLKVHRLVMNACTEYFTILEQNYPAMEENTIMMPGDLQSDVIVPIVNFMYTGMLEFHMSIFEKLYTAAELMNITILTKLLDAQRNAYQQHRLKQKSETKSKSEASWAKKPLQKEKAPSFSNDLPAPLPGRKVPAWKRKAASNPVPHPVSQLHFPEHRYPMDPLSIPDNTPKPTRFEWPEDDLPAFNFMDNSFEDFTLTSKPLLTKEDEDKAKPSFDDLRYNVEVPKKKASNSKASSSSSVNTAEVVEFVKEQKIRTAMFEDVESVEGGGQKRKIDQAAAKQPHKKVKVYNKENQETTISVEGSDLTDLANIDHTKIVAEILKKYPDLVKKNKNIKLKVMTSGNNKNSPEKIATPVVVENSKKTPVQAETVKIKPPIPTVKKPPKKKELPEEGPWLCRKCIAMGAEPQEFVLYYLYRKHMTDSHNEVFDRKLCKYCGKRCVTDNLMMYHMYTKHALKPPSSYNFPKCDRCPFIAQSTARLEQHKEAHKSNEMQCQDCKLAFTSSHALSAHVRVTGHYNKPGKTSFDCQYCMKKLQSAINLFTHIKNSHLREGKRDGIVCLDELDSMEDLNEEEESVKDEYILPVALPGVAAQKDKVKIISNVKVPPNRQKPDNAQSSSRVIQLDASSEAESLNNVASGIATSLGLVDIVVIDDNQQFILQQDGQGEQEFIIPELAAGQSFARQVITTQHNAVLQQGMIQSAGSDIGSTDELVMVLTDHEYPDEQEGENSDNSNIVVLYSHPVKGQEGQFITSQGNLLVNSQTGMLEIRNGPSIGGAPSGEVVDRDTPVESIEMIHREIHGTDAVMKEEPYFEEDGKADGPPPQRNEEIITESREEVVENESEDTPEESEAQESVDNSEENNKNDVLEGESEEKEKEGEDDVDGNEDIGREEPMEIDEIQENDRTEISQNDEQVYVAQNSPADTEKDTRSASCEIRREQPEPDDDVVDEEVNEAAAEEGVDVPPPNPLDTENVIVNDPTYLPSIESSQVDDGIERMEVDGNVSEPQENESSDIVEQEQSTSLEGQQTETEDAPKSTEESQPEHEETQSHTEETQSESEETQLEPEETQTEESTAEVRMEEPPNENQLAVVNESEGDSLVDNEVAGGGSTPAAEEDEDGGKTSEEGGGTSGADGNAEEATKKNQVDINKTILDDWEEEEDADSQHSGKQVHEELEEVDNSRDEADNQTKAVDNVNKLMDDWDEEEEEEKKDSK